MFDPFGDFDSAGYLRNVERLKDLAEVKQQEHLFFETHVEDASAYLRRQDAIVYNDFLEVHRILFGGFYPWAGQDRKMLGIGRLVGKGADIQFEAAESCRQATEWGLRLGNDTFRMRAKPGEVMGAFAWAHPFLDGNGRTMLLVHAELCARAGFFIDWRLSPKAAYLHALSAEITNPSSAALDRYFSPLRRDLEPNAHWVESIKNLPGLDGGSVEPDVAHREDDPNALRRYEEFKLGRGGN